MLSPRGTCTQYSSFEASFKVLHIVTSSSQITFHKTSCCIKRHTQTFCGLNSFGYIQSNQCAHSGGMAYWLRRLIQVDRLIQFWKTYTVFQGNEGGEKEISILRQIGLKLFLPLLVPKVKKIKDIHSVCLHLLVHQVKVTVICSCKRGERNKT